MKKIFLVLIMLIIVGICIPSMSAATILSENPSQYIDTGGQSIITGTGGTIGEANFNKIRLQDIERARILNYIAFDIEGGYGSVHPEGSAGFTYSLPNGHTGEGVCYVDHSRNALGQIIATRYTLFFYDWDIGELTGAQTITINRTFATARGYFSNSHVYNNGDSFAYLTVWDTSISALYGKYISTVSAGAFWQNKLTVETAYDGLDYQINLQRVFGDAFYGSTLTVNGIIGTLHSSKGVNDISLLYPADSITNISIENPVGSVYTYTIDNSSSTNTVTVYVKNSQNDALIANSHIVISANVNGEFHEVVNETLPGGIYTSNLQPTGGGLPNPDFYRLIATAEGYNSIMPYIDFEHGSDTTINAILDPIGGAPEDENNTFIDFYVRDINANPIAGATVKFGGYTLYTNNAGYTIFEVKKDNTYTWTVSKLGYGSVTGNAVIGSNARYTVNAVIAPEVTPTTPTPIPSATPVSPTPTLTAPNGEPVSNWLEWFAAHFGMILGGGVEIGKIFMWLCFTVPVGVYVGNKAKAGAAGFMAGAGIVTLFFVLIGWVPIWLVVLLALIIGLLYAKIYSNTDNGVGR